MYGVYVAVVGEHYVLTHTMRAYSDTSHIISVYFSGVVYLDVHFIGGDWWEGFSDGGIGL